MSAGKLAQTPPPIFVSIATSISTSTELSLYLIYLQPRCHIIAPSVLCKYWICPIPAGILTTADRTVTTATTAAATAAAAGAAIIYCWPIFLIIRSFKIAVIVSGTLSWTISGQITHYLCDQEVCSLHRERRRVLQHHLHHCIPSDQIYQQKTGGN